MASTKRYYNKKVNLFPSKSVSIAVRMKTEKP